MCSINPSKESYYKDALTHCEMYLRSYRALASKSSLTSEERQLMSELKSYLNESEREIRNDWGMIMVSAEVSGVGSAVLTKKRFL